MPARKTFTKKMESNRESMDMNGRRMDTVRKNFAVGVQRGTAAGGVNGEAGFNRKMKSTLSGR